MRAVLAIAVAALAQAGAQDLRPWLAPGMRRGEVEAQLENHLGARVAGAVPRALIAAAVVERPERFGDSIAESFRRYGFAFVEGRDTPAGMVETRVPGLVSYQFNCLACHAGRGVAPGERERWIVGATNRELDFGGYYGDVFGTLADAVDEVRAQLERAGDRRPSPLRVGRLASSRLLRSAGRGLLRERALLSPLDAATLVAMVKRTVEQERPPAGPAYGPGRTVVLAAYRAFRFDLPPGEFAPVKPPDLFGVRARETLLWTGNETYPAGTSAAERIANNGLLVPWIQLHPFTGEPVPDWVILARRGRFAAMGELLAKAAPPPAPAPEGAEAWARFRRGGQVFAQTCSECHGDYRHVEARTPAGGPGLLAQVVDYPELILDPDDVGTDPRYARSSDRAFLEAFAASGLGKARIFDGQLTGGYVARPLLGLRLRAPYLHNASVPSLEALLTPPEQRPAAFEVRSSRERALTRDTALPGNRAQGHPFGTDLDPEAKRDLIEFLRRL
ncbi:MAG: hypothetical protein R3F62_03990 [Planctomycetota bacterium]